VLNGRWNRCSAVEGNPHVNHGELAGADVELVHSRSLAVSGQQDVGDQIGAIHLRQHCARTVDDIDVFQRYARSREVDNVQFIREMGLAIGMERDGSDRNRYIHGRGEGFRGSGRF